VRQRTLVGELHTRPSKARPMSLLPYSSASAVQSQGTGRSTEKANERRSRMSFRYLTQAVRCPGLC
jgi:hypothetical protein